MKIELTDTKKACFMVGYITKIAETKNKKYHDQLKETLHDKNKMDKTLLNKVYTNSIIALTDAMADKADDTIDDLCEYTTSLLLAADNIDFKFNVMYYYTLGYTSKAARLVDNDIIID